MSTQTCFDSVCSPNLMVKERSWANAKELWQQFISAHPELGLSSTDATFYKFTRTYGRWLLKNDVLRRAGGKAPYMANVDPFDEAAFDLLSRRGYRGVQGGDHVNG